MTVTPQDRDAMADILRIMEGKAPINREHNKQSDNTSLDIIAPGTVSKAEIDAMANVLNKLNQVSTDIVSEMITESEYAPEVDLALKTQKNQSGVKVGRYQIMIKEDQKRLAGKQYYSIYNTRTNDVIADDLSLYETALNVVKFLNSGKYVNSTEVIRLFAHDEAYTSHRQDAIRYKKAMMIAERKNDQTKIDIYESRYQASVDRAMKEKKTIKTFKNVN